VSHQVVIPGFLTGLCTPWRWGEVPVSPQFRLRNAVHLADRDALKRAGIDRVAWQRPFAGPVRAEYAVTGSDADRCEAALRRTFGTPVYADHLLVVFEVR
jgi:hypothetical protein